MKESLSYQNGAKTAMDLIVYKPEAWQSHDRRTAVVFFYGGGFVKRNLKHFGQQSQFLAQKGYVCFCPDYRLTGQETEDIRDCFADGAAALRQIKARSDEFGIDPKRIAVSGGSAGGALACIAAMETGIPFCQVLFNPKLDMFSHRIHTVYRNEEEKKRADRVPSPGHSSIILSEEELTKISACQRLETHKIPPTLLYVGDRDFLAFKDVIYFQYRADQLGLDCRTIVYSGEEHGFFNYYYSGELAGIADEKTEKRKFCYEDTLERLYTFIRQNEEAKKEADSK
ncbi:MAG: alpha/beta hydrolase [Lachnospiraceae bacterium]|jgi:acetyl esterase|nr:alpha/beta hydrolase [Lachnospiraceae bacterium]